MEVLQLSKINFQYILLMMKRKIAWFNRRSLMPSFWDWFLHFRALSKVIQESQRIQRQRLRDVEPRCIVLESNYTGRQFAFASVEPVMRLSHTSSLFFPYLFPEIPRNWFVSFLSLLQDLAGDRTHSLPHAKRALYHYANAGTKLGLITY